jgi:integrase
MGLYQRPDSDVFWMSYMSGGKRVRESARTTDRKEAERILKDKEGRLARGEVLLPRVDRITYDEIAEDLREHYRATGDRDLREAEGRLHHLGQAFTGHRVVHLGAAEITRYIVSRQRQQAANSTINRELAVLGRMLRLAFEHGKLARVPVIHKLKEAAPRSGFFERDQFEAVRRHLSDDLRVVVTLAYTFGWRTQSEVLPLQQHQLDLEAETLRLDPGTTKNDEGQIVYLTPELKALLTAQVNRVKTLERQLGRIVPWLFAYADGSQRKDFRKAWATACRRAGVAGRMRHDFRRTAVRNMVSGGVSERVAMTITGHRTRSVFDRYHIVSPSDLKEAAKKIAARW